MSLPMLVALTVGPLACYFYVVGVWQSGRHPRVVAGPADFAVLAFGVSGLLTVGPVGQLLMRLIFGLPGMWAWALWAVFLALWAIVFASWASRRTVVYNVDPARLTEAVGRALDGMAGSRFAATLGGFESAADGRAVLVEGIRRLRVGTVDARGREAEALARELRPLLRDQLSAVTSGPTRVTWGLFVLSWITMLAPLVTFLVTEPRAARPCGPCSCASGSGRKCRLVQKKHRFSWTQRPPAVVGRGRLCLLTHRGQRAEPGNRGNFGGLYGAGPSSI